MTNVNDTQNQNANPNPMEIEAMTVTARHPLLDQLVEILWPPEDPERQWDPDTIEDVAGVLNDYQRDLDYTHQDKVRCRIAAYFCPGLSGLSYDAIDSAPIDYDFTGENWDPDQGSWRTDEGGMKWYVEPHPDIESQLEDLEDEVDLPSSEPDRESVLYVNKPESDGTVTLTCSVDLGGYDPQSCLTVLANMIADLDAMGIAHNLDMDDDPEDVCVDLGRDDKGWEDVIALFGLDPDLFEEDDPDLEHERWSPMMNYAYPLPQGCRTGDDWHRVMCCTTIVRIGDQACLALTGGGMDFTWEICEAHLRCGYWPPAHFARRLPMMCGRGTSERDRLIMAACRVSLQHTAEAALNALAGIDRVEEWAMEREAKSAAQ